MSAKHSPPLSKLKAAGLMTVVALALLALGAWARDGGERARASTPYLCGNGQLDEGEQCDPRAESEATCQSVSELFTGGALLCDPASCTFDTSQCEAGPVARCGDGVLEGAEQCELGAAFQGRTCEAEGLGPPGDSDLLFCDHRTCRWSTVNCQSGRGECGNGVAEGPEQCDGADFRGLVCENIQLATNVWAGSGTLQCNAQCRLDLSACRGPQGEICGNGKREPNLNEQCDGKDLGGASCLNVNRLWGRPKCSAQCRLDYTGCRGGCTYTRLGTVCD